MTACSRAASHSAKLPSTICARVELPSGTPGTHFRNTLSGKANARIRPPRNNLGKLASAELRAEVTRVWKQRVAVLDEAHHSGDSVGATIMAIGLLRHVVIEGVHPRPGWSLPSSQRRQRINTQSFTCATKKRAE